MSCAEIRYIGNKSASKLRWKQEVDMRWQLKNHINPVKYENWEIIDKIWHGHMEQIWCLLYFYSFGPSSAPAGIRRHLSQTAGLPPPHTIVMASITLQLRCGVGSAHLWRQRCTQPTRRFRRCPSNWFLERCPGLYWPRTSLLTPTPVLYSGCYIYCMFQNVSAPSPT